tara:strand:- start:291 stop:662 length:372 start_codon:yes stop_codon:yes gene_type:complete
MNNNHRRRNFRGRPQKNNFRRRTSSNHGSNGHFTNNLGNKSFNRNGSLSNPLSIEKVISKYQQLAKDAQSSGDPVLIENYLQHAEHYSRKLAEINFKSQTSTNSPTKNDDNNSTLDSSEDNKI